MIEYEKNFSTIDKVAAKLDCKTGPDLIVATAAFLTFGAEVAPRFNRKRLLDEMKTSSYYKKSYASNMSTYLQRLVKKQELYEVAKGVYQLPPGRRDELKTKLHLPDEGIGAVDSFAMKLDIAAASGRLDILSTLRQHLQGIRDDATRRFVEEAIVCIENDLHRSAVVLSWVGAMSILQNYVAERRLDEFNAEASRQRKKWYAAKTADDLSHMHESTFLDVLESSSIIGKAVTQELRKCLALRNRCSHPNSLEIGHAIVAAHVEVLLLNVFAKYRCLE